MGRRPAAPVTALSSLPDLRGGLSIDEWQARNVTIVNDEGLELPFFDNAVQRAFAQKIAFSEARAAASKRPPRDLCIKPRRGGGSEKLCKRLLIRGVTERNKDFLYINANEEDTVDTFHDKIRKSYDLLPDRVRPRLRNPENRRGMELIETGCSIRTKPASVAGGVRGRGFAEGVWDEVPRVAETMPTIEEQRRFLAGVLPAFRFGAFRLLFTPDGCDDIAYALWQESAKGENDFNRIFVSHFECDDTKDLGISPDQFNEIEATLTEEETFQLDRFGILGPDRIYRIAWRRRLKRELRHLFPQEYPEDEVSCWIQPGTSFFEHDAVRWQHANARPPIETGDWAPRHNGAIVYYVPPHPDHDYIVASDYGLGHGSGDPSMSVVLDYDANEIVAEAWGHVPATTFTDWTIRELCLPYNEALWAPEMGGPGDVAVEHARRAHEYVRLYRHVRADAAGNVSYDHRFGFPTDAGTRPRMLEDLDRAFSQHELRVNSRRALADCQSFKLRSIGGKVGAARKRYQAESGEHDEGVMVLGIANYVRQTGMVRPGIG